MTRKSTRRVSSYVHGVLVFLVVVFLFLPIIWILMTSFKPMQDVYTSDIWFRPTFANYRYIFGPNFGLGAYYLNSVIVVTVTLLIALPVSLLAAYSLSRFRVRGKQVFLFFVLATQFVPMIINLVPFFIMFRNLSLLDTRIGLIIVDLGNVIPYALWMLKGYIDKIPADFEEAMMIDGCGRLKVIWYVLIPLARSGIITAAVYTFVITWNEFMFATVLTSEHAVTLPVALSMFIGDKGVLWNGMAAAGIVTVLPAVVFMFMVRKQFVQGMTAGGLK